MYRILVFVDIVLVNCPHMPVHVSSKLPFDRSHFHIHLLLVHITLGLHHM